MKFVGPRYVNDSLGDLEGNSLSQAFHRMRIQQQVAAQTERVIAQNASKQMPGSFLSGGLYGSPRSEYPPSPGPFLRASPRVGFESPSPPRTPLRRFRREEWPASPASPFMKGPGRMGVDTSPRSIVDAHVAGAYWELLGEDPLFKNDSPGLHERSQAGGCDLHGGLIAFLVVCCLFACLAIGLL